MKHESLRKAELVTWFSDFASCVRRRDLAAGEAMFCDKVVAFGTRNEMMRGLSELKNRQWAPTWGSTKDFFFDESSLVLGLSPAEDTAWGAVLWHSTGLRADGASFDRRGRASFAFRHDRHWLCTHSHLSYMPSGDL